MPNLNNSTFSRIVQEWLESGLRYAIFQTLFGCDIGEPNLKIQNIEKWQKSSKGRKIAKHESFTKARVSPVMLRAFVCFF